MGVATLSMDSAVASSFAPIYGDDPAKVGCPVRALFQDIGKILAVALHESRDTSYAGWLVEGVATLTWVNTPVVTRIDFSAYALILFCVTVT